MTPETAWAEAMKFENRPNPYPFFDELRKTPVAHVGNGAYAVTGYRELMTIMHDPRLSSDKRKIAAPPAAEPSFESEANPVEAYGRGPMMIQADPPDHDRARRQAMRHFGPPHSPDLIPSMEVECQRIVNEQLDKVKGKTRMDVVDDYAYMLPTTVIFKVIGLPLEDEPRIHAMVEAAFDGADLGPEAATPEGKVRAEKGAAARSGGLEYFGKLVERYAREPDESSMLSKMMHDAGPDGPMTHEELLGNAALLVVAGHDSTVNLISHCVLTFLRNPGTIELLRGRPDLIPGGIEEVLRVQSSVQFFPKFALEDIEVGGTVIPKGSPVFPVYGAANRDPLKFPNPNKFDPERRDNEHFGWGSGIHTCFGGPLARLEVNTAIEVFLRRVENPRLVVDPPPYRRNQIFRGPRHLLIDFDGIKD
jgi:fatty acid omega-hydroxylase